MTDLKIIFRDINPRVVAAFQARFGGIDAWDIACGDIFSGAPADAIISPANSHGWMDGGIDALYVRRFGTHVEEALQSAIQFVGWSVPGYSGVGSAIAVRTLDPAIPFMISAPTMDEPGPLRAGSKNVFLAFYAALALARKWGLYRILTPGLGTCTGRMHPDEAARQMYAAWMVLQ